MKLCLRGIVTPGAQFSQAETNLIEKCQKISVCEPNAAGFASFLANSAKFPLI